jgi:hypothetical protein
VPVGRRYCIKYTHGEGNVTAEQMSGAWTLAYAKWHWLRGERGVAMKLLTDYLERTEST